MLTNIPITNFLLKKVLSINKLYINFELKEYDKYRSFNKKITQVGNTQG